MESIDNLKIYRQMVVVVRLAREAYAPYKKGILLLTLLSFLGGLLEGIGINAVIPLLTFMLNIQVPATDTISVAIRGFFDLLHVPFVPKFLLSFIVVLFIGKALVTLLLTYVQIRITTEYERATRARLFSTVLHSSWPHLLRQKLGNLETLLMIDTPAALAMLGKISFTITTLSSLTMYLLVAFLISPSITIATFGLGVFVFILLRPLMDRVHGLSRERAVVYRDTMHHAGEHMSGIKTVKAYSVEEQAIDKGESLFLSIKDLSSRVQIIQNVATQAVAPVGVIYIAGILALAFKTPFISFAALPAIFYLIYRIFTYVQQLQNNIQYISEGAPHLERVLTYERTAREENEPEGGSLPFVFERDLKFDGVSFSYDKERGVLHGVTFPIRKGQMVGIVGPSGAGKTTCVDLLLRLLRPTSGKIVLDGVDCREISLAQWRARIAYVSQDLFLLQGTIRDNIRFYDTSISDETVWEAARSAHIDDFIRECPAQLDTPVGDRGMRLSAGQRQRITIARALARKPDILILDEATSALDAESEAHIKRVIDGLKGRVTIVAIAHRLSTIMDSDQLVVLQDGRLMETGSPEELLGNPKSYFYKVYTISQ